MKIGRSIAFAVALVVAPLSAAHGEANFGRFIGKFVAEFGDDGRKVTLMEPFGYVDPAGLEWNVPDGYKTDGGPCRRRSGRCIRPSPAATGRPR
jgi:hypothetical protein